MKSLHRCNTALRTAFTVGFVVLLLGTLLSAGKRPKPLTRVKPTEVKKETEMTTAQPTVPQVNTQTYLMPSHDRAGEQINWYVMAGGGGMSSAGSFMLGSSIGQPPVGLTTVGDHSLRSGFWQDFDNDSYLCGDADGSGGVNIADVVYLIAYIFGGPAPSPPESADADCSGGVNIADAVYLVAYIFGSNPAPCDPDGDGTPDC